MYLVSQRCAKKSLVERGVPTLPLTESPLKSYPEKAIPKRAKNGVFVFNKVRNGPKRPFNGLKSAKKKGKIIEFLDQKYLRL